MPNERIIERWNQNPEDRPPLPPQNVQANSNIKKALANKFFLIGWHNYDDRDTPSVPLTDVIDKRIYFFKQGPGRLTGMVEARRDPDGVTIHVLHIVDAVLYIWSMVIEIS